MTGQIAEDASREEAVTSEAALQLLQQGNARFAEGRAGHPHTDAARMAETAERGQHPFAAILACADSRVPVERIVDRGIGDLFVIRVAGNVCDTNEIATVEFALASLELPLVVVLGHTLCGAITAVVTEADLGVNVRPLLDKVRPAVDKARQGHPKLRGDDLVNEAVLLNVWQSIEHLLRRSAATRERVRAGRLIVVGAVYGVGTGRIDWLGPHPKQQEI